MNEENNSNLNLSGPAPESAFYNNAVFFVEVDKISPNPYQPRREFDQGKLMELANSIRMYGVLQPLVVTRSEVLKEDGGLAVQYELIAGERRLRASKLAGLREVPVLIRSTEDDEKTKLELAIIENLQREDLNPIDKARAFKQLVEEFGFKHAEVARKVGKSREYISNTIRILSLPEEIQQSISEKKLTEGHARPLLMLSDRPEEQNVLFREILLKKLTVRDAEKISRKIAVDRVRKHDREFSPEIIQMEDRASEILGTRVEIEPREKGGRIRIDYTDEESLRTILAFLNNQNDKTIDNVNDDIIHNNVDNSNTEKITESTPLKFNDDGIIPLDDVELDSSEWESENNSETKISDFNDENDDNKDPSFSLDKFGI